jgi:hypothetical protein
MSLSVHAFVMDDGGDLYVMPEDVDEFLAECELVRASVAAIAATTRYQDDYISRRLGNIIAAAHRAKAVEGGGSHGEIDDAVSHLRPLDHFGPFLSGARRRGRGKCDEQGGESGEGLSFSHGDRR